MKPRWAYLVFNTLLLAAFPFLGLFVLLRWRQRIFSKGADHWSERWGRLSKDQLAQFEGWLGSRTRQTSGGGGCWWVHAVSMGEVKAIEAFLRQAPAEAGVRILLSAVTPEALAWAKDHKVADVIIAAPLDFPWIVRRVMRAVRPSLFISVESEFWPNLLREAQRSGARVALINGRISSRSHRSYARIQPFLPALWQMIDLFAVRQPEDASRFRSLGVPEEKIQITGNLKYDLYMERRAHKRPDAPVVVVGSTREGEESQLLPVMERVRTVVPGVQIIWAPRHIERVPELEKLLADHGLAYRRVSQIRRNGSGVDKSPNVLWDSMGDLLDAYRQAHVAVIGGSFVPRGGQNPIEPAALRLPVLFGPSMDNFQSVADNLVRAGGARCVSADTLDEQLTRLLQDPKAREAMGECAHQAVLAEQGATSRTLKLLKDLLNA